MFVGGPYALILFGDPKDVEKRKNVRLWDDVEGVDPDW